MLVRFLVAAAVMTAITVVYEPARLLAFPRERPGIYVLVMLLYPLLSVYPQGLIYRAFIIHRYRGLFGTGALAIIGSALAFGLAHVVLLNWIAPLFTLIGGLMFAHTYRKSGSLTVAAIEHAAYGNFLFTIGLGWYFYSGWRSGG